MSVTPDACHGRAAHHALAEARPTAGTPPWTWWYASFHRHVRLELADLGERWAQVSLRTDRPVVTLHHRLTTVQRNFSLTHEMHHLAIGGVCESYCPKNEALVVRETARWLMPDVEALAAELLSGSVQRVAKQHGLPTFQIFDRLRHMTPAERRVFDEAMRSPVEQWSPTVTERLAAVEPDAA